MLQTKPQLPNHLLILVADSGFGALELLASVRCHVCVIARLGWMRCLPTLRAVLASRKTVWTTVVVSQWYNAQQRKLLTAPRVKPGGRLWYSDLVHAGISPVPIRWVLVRDPTGEHEPAAFLSTDLDATPAMILGWLVSRWRVETTFQEVRTHLGVETQRQWSDRAILHITPAPLGLFSLIVVWADGLARDTTTALRANAAA